MKKICLTLKERPERTALAKQEFERVGLNFEFHYGTLTPDGRLGCRLGQLEMMGKADKNQLLFLAEDDIMFIQPLSVLAKAIRQLPKYWCALWLGSTLTKDLDRHSDNLFRLKGGWTTHGIIYNPKCGILDDAIKRGQSCYKVDVMLAELQEQYNCFVTYPMVASQRPGYSDIVKKHTEYKVISEWYHKHTKG